MNNHKFVQSLMESERYGPMAQLVVVSALESYTRSVANTPIEKLRKSFGDNPIVDPEVWQAVCNEIQAKFAMRDQKGRR